MSKHTPGPWTVYSRINRYAAAEEKLPHGTASYIIKAAKDRTIARITHAPGIADVQAADARLIAAAPDLLEALKLMVAQFTKGSAPSTVKDSEARIKAHAAISKSEGRE